MKIVFYISDHGYGHLMRNLPVMEDLKSRGHEIVLVTSQKLCIVAAQYINNLETVYCSTDAGLVVESGTLDIDKIATIDNVRSHIECWNSMINTAVDADLYVVDIVPWALIAAKQKGIPSVLMASFTWIEQYEGFLPDDLLKRYIEAYSMADNVFYYELVNEPTKKRFGKGKNVGFVARPFDMKKVNEIKKRHNQPIVFLSLGCSNSGLDLNINVNDLPYDFITTSALKLVGKNVEYITADTPNTQDYIKAAKYCITKAGWATVSEIMLANVPFAVLERNDTPEDTMIIEELQKRRAAVSVKPHELKDMGNIMSLLKKKKFIKQEYKNNISRIADLIGDPDEKRNRDQKRIYPMDGKC